MVDNYLLRKEDELKIYMLQSIIEKISINTYTKLNKLFEEIINDKIEIINNVFNGL